MSIVDEALGPTPTGRRSIVDEALSSDSGAGRLDAAANGEPGLASKLAGRLSDAYGGLKESFQPTTETMHPNTAYGMVKMAGAAGGAMVDTFDAILPESVKALGKELYEPIAQQPAAKYLTAKLGELVQRNPKEAKLLGDVSGLFMAPGIMRGAKAVMPAVKEVGNIAADVGRLTAREAGAATEKLASLVRPKPEPTEALKQILQGKTKDLPKGQKAFQAVDTTGVNTYADLDKRLADHVGTYAKQVDAELMRDSTPHPMADLVIKTKTGGGATVTQNHVEDALAQLKELYEKINDPVRKKEIQELTEVAWKNGMTKKEVNDLARTYGNEFGDKAFSKQSGDPLTSINAQAYENTRKGLKETAREGMGPEAKELDSTLSSIINTRRLIEKNVEAVNKLRSKVDPRSPLEKVGRVAVKTADTLSGGLVRGIVGGLLPRGVGNKVFNALDLEEKLTRNLRIVNDAIKQAEGTAGINLSSETGKTIQSILSGGETDLRSYLAMPNERLPVEFRGTNDLPTITQALGKVERQIADLQGTIPNQTDYQAIVDALRAKKIPYMRIVNEDAKGFEERLIDTYKRSISQDLPTLPGKEPPELTALKTLQAKLQTMTGGKSAVPSDIQRKADAAGITGTSATAGPIPGGSGRNSGGIAPALAEKARRQGVMVPDEALKEEAANIAQNLEAQYKADAVKYGVKFNGLQEFPGREPIPLFTMTEGTKTTFALQPGETVPQAIARKQAQETTSKHVSKATAPDPHSPQANMERELKKKVSGNEIPF